MVMNWIDILSTVAAIGNALMAGVFFAFSTFVIQSLSALAPRQAVAAMQSINKVILRSLFMLLFFGSTIASIGLLLAGIMLENSAIDVYLVTGCLLNLVGVFVVTIVFNVPLNDSLTTVDTNNEDCADEWASYVSGWLPWNHVRTLLALLSSISFVLALNQGG